MLVQQTKTKNAGSKMKNTCCKNQRTNHLFGASFLALLLAGAAYAACNVAGTTVTCGTLGNSCSTFSPNCMLPTPINYSGTVTHAGSRTTITSGSPGKDGQKQGSLCKYVCKIASDCAGQSPEVDISGAVNVTPDGQACE